MSSSVRQDNLFSSEDWQAVYRSFRDVDFRAYDFDSIRDALIDYVRTFYPESFNDYIESSEFIAVIELLAFLASSLAFRVDLNSRENFLETAQRRESIIRLARFINYQPSRNLPARGLVKLTAVQTNQLIQDSRGQNLNNVLVFWDDDNNPDSFEQFTTILNNAFVPTNPFGRPVKSGQVGGINTDLYQMAYTLGVSVAYNINVKVRGTGLPFDVVNADLRDGQSIVERAPDPAAPFHLVHRNDGEGASSPNTGFFLHIRQGELIRTDAVFDFPVPNRVFDINVDNINNQDVYVQEIDQDGAVIAQWSQVPALFDNNAVFDILNQNQQTIYSVISRPQDQISLRFGDDTFGQAPQGIFRIWHRVSANQNVVVRADDLQNYEITVPYQGQDGQVYTLRMVFSLQQTLVNAAAAETNAEVQQRAPQVYYTQNRMVNGQDYNVFPLLLTPNIVKIKAINRTHAGHSRFIDINDPTGTIQNTQVIGDDGALYQEPEPVLLKAPAAIGFANVASISVNQLIKNQFLENFFYGSYLDQFKEFTSPAVFDLSGVTWVTRLPSISESTQGSLSGLSLPNRVHPGAWLRFEFNNQVKWTQVLAVDTPIVELEHAIPRNAAVTQVLPRLRTQLSNAEVNNLIAVLENQSTFGLGYSIDANSQAGGWYVIPTNVDPNAEFDIDPASANSWLIYASYDSSELLWRLTSRGVRYVFESRQQARFYLNETFTPLDVQKLRPVADTIEILPVNTQNNSSVALLLETLSLAIDNLVTLEDGYQDPRKAVVRNLSHPSLLHSVVNGFGQPQRLFFERFTDFDGFDYFRLWQTGTLEVANSLEFGISLESNLITINGRPLNQVGLLIGTTGLTTRAGLLSSVTAFVGSNPTAIDQLIGLVLFDTNNKFYKLVESSTPSLLEWQETPDHRQVLGRSFELDQLNTATTSPNFYYRWKHFAPRSNRVDPSISNIIDINLITSDYLQQVTEWKNSPLMTQQLPVAPTTEQLRLQFSELDQFKMISDQIIFKPGQFKVLFGKGAEPELAARFKVVKLPTATATTSEIKSRVIEAIEQYFDIRNWDFGESFFYTELGAFIHQRLNNIISTVVIVPQKAESVFGNLFQIKCEPNQIFLSTATVADVEVVRNLTETNLRIRGT